MPVLTGPKLTNFIDTAIMPGNGEGLFGFQHFTNLSLTYVLGHLPTYFALDPHGAWENEMGMAGAKKRH